jgi:Nucleotidyl transferase
MRILILGAGPTAADQPPVWLAENQHGVLIERLAQSCASLNGRMVFAVRLTDMRRYKIESVIGLVAPGSLVVPIRGETAGAACTALLCIRHLEPDQEVLILNNNEIIDIDYGEVVADFRQRHLDAGVVTFPSVHPRYSYVALDDDGLVVEAAEKHPISRHATAGFYWFRRSAEFVEAVQNMIRKDAHVDGRFFISPVFNEYVLSQKRVGIFETDSRRYQPLKSRRQISIYEADTDSGPRS